MHSETTHVSRQLYFIVHHWIPMDFRSIQLNLMEQVRATTFELRVRKLIDLVLIGGRDLNGSNAEKMLMMMNK